MAKILRTGKTPLWGTGQEFAGYIIDSFNISPEIKDYEQTDENGAVCGYLVYDQTVNYDISGTILSDDTNKMSLTCLSPIHLGNVLSFGFGYNTVNCQINNPSTIILKSYNISRSAGNAATFSATATGYDINNLG